MLKNCTYVPKYIVGSTQANSNLLQIKKCSILNLEWLAPNISGDFATITYVRLIRASALQTVWFWKNLYIKCIKFFAYFFQVSQSDLS